MGAQFLIPLVTVIPGQLIASSLWNGEFNNIGTNFIPAGMDSYSTTDAQMQIQTAPYPGSVTSHATNLGGEFERLRYQIAALVGQTYWYQDIGTGTPTFGTVTANGTTPSFFLEEAGVLQARFGINASDTFIDFGGTLGRLIFRSGIDGTTIMTLSPTFLDIGGHKIQDMAQGTNTGEAIAFPVTASEIQANTITAAQIANNTITATQLANGAVGTTQLATAAVSQIVSGGTTAVGDQSTLDETLNITTTGGTILVLASISIQATTGGSATTLTMAVTRGGSGLAGNSAQVAFDASSINLRSASIMAIDTPAAGTYAYKMSHGWSSAPTELVKARSFVVIELKR